MELYLVIQLARFGDIIQTARLIESLLCQGEVHLVVDNDLVALAHRVYPKCTIHGISLNNSSTNGVLLHNYRLFSDIAQLEFSSVFNLNFSKLNMALSSLFPSEIVRGYRVENGQVFREQWMKMIFRWTQQRAFAPLNLVDFWGLLASEPVAPHSVNPSAAPGGEGLGVVIAGRDPRRSLPPDVLAQIITILFDTIEGNKILLFGGKGERALGRRIISYLPGKLIDKTHNLAGKTNFLDLADALMGLDIVLTPDTGTMHLAARLGVPVCGTFLSSAWAWETGPYGEGHSVWQSIPDCAPCAEAEPCPFQVQCLNVYRSPAFFKRFSGMEREGSSGILHLTSSFDELGLQWNAHLQNDPYAATRAAQRALLKEYIGISFIQSQFFQGMKGSQLAEQLYSEADWML